MTTCDVRVPGKNLRIRADLADTFGTRFKGLMFRKELPAGTGLLLKDCSSIHMFFMRFPIAAVYMDEVGCVLRTEVLKPWTIGSLVRETASVLELTPADGKEISVGDRLVFEFSKEEGGED